MSRNTISAFFAALTIANLSVFAADRAACTNTAVQVVSQVELSYIRHHVCPSKHSQCAYQVVFASQKQGSTLPLNIMYGNLQPGIAACNGFCVSA